MTRTMKVQELVLPEASTAVQVTVVEPFVKSEHEGGAQETLGSLSQASVGTGVGKVTTAPPELRGFSATFKVGGQVISGGVVSTMCTVLVAATRLVAPTTPTGWPRLLA